MIYITFEREGPKFSNITARALTAHSRAAVSVESKMATVQHKTFSVREFIKTESHNCLEICEPQPPGTPRAYPGL